MYANIYIHKIFQTNYGPAQIRADKQNANRTFSFPVEPEHKGKYEWLCIIYRSWFGLARIF